ncbi:protein of unknown function (DUF565) [Rubidibacter lacunae KORDI 51-2]|uniref:DUF565 domain-containing protein n=1 Tax=Rubidibacter lacunae KORDI 51-2 TaxID=582515 RepID=U5DDT0_9CHRO|nr:DUF565 domain-containing protein [Rubidibacter lacunae]ERN42668.1 protein of unknown function (DUF565) [Rubidibacter lacunae KORDI 51-2]
MQNTRLTLLTRTAGDRLQQFFVNPWRRLSAIAIGSLSGFFLGSAITLTTGQRGTNDLLAAALLLLFVELVNFRVYRLPPARGGNTPPRPLWVETLSALKLGLTFCLFLEAFKLGS